MVSDFVNNVSVVVSLNVCTLASCAHRLLTRNAAMIRLTCPLATSTLCRRAFTTGFPLAVDLVKRMVCSAKRCRCYRCFPSSTVISDESLGQQLEEILVAAEPLSDDLWMGLLRQDEAVVCADT